MSEDFKVTSSIQPTYPTEVESTFPQQKQNNNRTWKVVAAFSVLSLAYFTSAAITASKINCDDVRNTFTKCQARHGFSRWSGADNPSAEIAFRVAMFPWDLLDMAFSCSKESGVLSACESAASLLIPKAGAVASIVLGSFAIKKLASKN